MLRAIRFAARYGFHVDPDTEGAIRVHAAELAGVSRERIGHELRGMFRAGGAVAAIGRLETYGLAEPILGPIGGCPGSVVSESYDALTALPPDAGFGTGLAAWALDRDAAGATAAPEGVADDFSAALILSNVERGDLARCLRIVGRLPEWSDLTVAAQKRLAAEARFQDALSLFAARASGAAEAIATTVEELRRTGLQPEPFLTGRALIEAGFEPGPSFSPLIEAVYDAQLEGRIDSLDAALALARTLSDDPNRP